MNQRIAEPNRTPICKILLFFAKTIFSVLIFLIIVFPSNAQKIPLQTKTYLLDDQQTKVEVSIYNNESTSVKKVDTLEGIFNSQVMSNCNTYSEIDATNISQGGPLDEVGCQNNDSIEICFRIFNFNSGSGTNSCQYLHGLVPDFGTCLNVNPTPTGEPGAITQPMTNNSNFGVWQWFPDGVTTYNNIPGGYLPPGEPVGAGWFYVYRPGSNPLCTDYTNPNCTWGDGNNCSDNNGLYWEVCFLAEPICTEPGTEFCEISFRTFGDGETGGWEIPGCENDQEWTYSFTKNCCEEPEITNTELDFTVCSGDLFELELTSNMDPETTYDWFAYPNPNPYGATSGTGTTISDVLTNNTGSPVTVTYVVTPTCLFGCIGEQVTITVTILPEVKVELWTESIICQGECVSINSQVSPTSSIYTYDWSNGGSTPNIFDCPYWSTIYTVTVTNDFGCTGEASIFVDVFEMPEVSIEASNTQACENGPDFPIVLDANVYGGSGYFMYNWSTSENEASILVESSGIYTVEVIDLLSYCSDIMSISVEVFPEPDVFITGPDILCENDPVSCFTAYPSGGYWSGGLDQNGCLDPGSLNSGIHTISYFYQDENGCTKEEFYTVEIIESPAEPIISCTSTIESVTFNWTPVNGAIAYLVNGEVYSGFTYEITGLDPGETVSITVEAIGAGACGNSIAQANCTTNDCPILNIELSEVPALCQQDGAITLESNVTGGQWFGAGIVNSEQGLFDPSQLSAGIYEVEYTFLQGNCSYSESMSIQIDEPLDEPIITCLSTTESVSFIWSEVPGAIAYLINGVEQQGTSYELTNLSANETVALTIEAIGAGACGNSVAQASCTTNDCPILNIGLSEVPALCQQDETITLESNVTGGQWFGAGIINSEQGLFDPSQLSAGIYEVEYTLTQGNCSYSESMSIQIDEPLDEPIITCSSTTESVSFSWAEVPGAIAYIINGVEQSGTSYELTNLSANETVAITIEAIGAGPCGNSMAQASCTTNDCPILNIELNEVPALCQQDGAINLESNVTGGQWYGTGIINSEQGFFDPSQLSAGIYEVEYTLTQGNCSYSESMSIQIDESLSEPVITCSSTTESVSFSWAEVPGAIAYLINGVEQQGTSYELTNLSANETVAITLEAIGAGACGNSIAQASCTTNDCPILNIELSEVPALCQQDGTITLESNVTGGQWYGTGIINSEQGLFDPSQLSAGIYEVEYMLAQGNCTYTESLSIKVDETLSEPLITCSSTTESVSFSWAEVPGAVGYIVNGIEQQGTGYEVTDLSAGETVALTIEAIGEGACGNSIAQTSCTTNDCPILNIELSEVPAICQQDGAIALESNVPGGQWYSAGIINSEQGFFDPSQLSAGIYEVQYTLVQGNCSYSESISIQIEEALTEPVITCSSTTESVSFIWTEVPGAIGYFVNGIEQLGTTYELTNLPANETVNINVEAIGVGACGNSLAQASCTTNECPALNFYFPTVENQCLGEQALSIVQLEVDIQNNGIDGVGQWIGAGITDSANGLFDPNDSALQEGSNSVVYIYEENGCIYHETVLINVFSAPEIYVTENMVLNCLNESITIESTGEGTPFWEGPGILSGHNTDQPVVNAPGIYLLTRTDFNGCTNTASVLVTEDFTTPIAQTGADQEITCAASTCQLTSIGNDLPHLLPQWSGPGINSNNVNLSNPTVDFPGIYELSILNTENGCVSEPVTVNVTENVLPPLNEIISIGIFDCNTDAIVLSSLKEENIHYEWIFPDGQTISAPTVEIFEPGIYTLIATDILNGCSSTEVIEVQNLNEIPVADAGTNQFINCIEETAVLDGSGSDFGTDINYQWNGPAGGIIDGNNTQEATVVLDGMYILNVYNTLNGCSSSDTVFVTLNQTLPELDAGLTQEFSCETQMITLVGTAASNIANINWANEEGEVIAQSLETEISEPGWYYLQATNAENGCIGEDSVLITVNENVPYELNLETQGISCNGMEDGSVSVIATNGGQQPYQYSFDGQDFNEGNTWDLLPAGTYPITVKDAEGCTYETMIEIPDKAPIILELGDDLLIELGETHTLQVQTNLESEQIEGVYWTPFEQVTCLDNDCLDIQLSPLASTSLELYIVDVDGCTAVDEIQLRVKKKRGVFIPNIFTPNDDGVNDVFYIQGLPSVKMVKRFVIYDRWGAVVFENNNININDPQMGWDGTYKGERLDSGVFIYTAEIEFADGFISVLKGDVTIVK